MDGEAVSKIVEVAQEALIAERHVVDIEDLSYHLSGGRLHRIRPPAMDTVAVHTLGGFVGYLQSDDWPGHPLKVHVVDEKTVRALGPLEPKHRTREVACEAAFVPLFGDSFRFGAYYQVESFIISLLTLFVPTPERAAVLRLVGNMTDQAELRVMDDGVSQEVSTRAGVMLKEMSALPNPVELRPYRTFRELPQPASPFVLRVQRQPEKAPMVGLFEADGGAWRLTAIAAIYDYLKAKLPEATILA